MISSEMMQLVQRCASVRDIADGFMEGVSRFSEELKLAYEIILNYCYVTWPKSFFKSVTYASNCLN